MIGWRNRPGVFKKQPEAEDKPESIKGHLALTAYVFSAYPIYYGSLALIFGDAIWKPERSAFGIPLAPQSVGVVMVVAGILTIIAVRLPRGGRRYVSWCMKTMTLMWGIFSVTFLIDVFQGDSPEAYAPVGAYLMLAILCADRATLEDQWRT
ncbi:putative holin [Tsukamurella phage TIN4]|uniref:Putative holin n=2 Tax=Tinduovirus TIN3 TaxID=1982571 RepID=A0A0K0N617_9CAUD|nr:putative holin [Tsukamurella phage TIN3]YP_009604162.1 putative holin [Tsukamurella phage TIN4]AKJ71829.1 putative holin [Tsukamurella phage TIN3]AKJ71938.1 putative holin [Tsukamurella phage TIN4]